MPIEIMRTLEDETAARVEAYRLAGFDGLARRLQTAPAPPEIALMIAASRYPQGLNAAALITRKKRTLKRYLKDEALARLAADSAESAGAAAT